MSVVAEEQNLNKPPPFIFDVDGEEGVASCHSLKLDITWKPTESFISGKNLFYIFQLMLSAEIFSSRFSEGLTQDTQHTQIGCL